MSILTEVSIPDAFIIFFITLGPLKAIGPFAQATRGADHAFRRTVAWRATTIATAIVFGVALVGAAILGNWKVSIPAVVVAGSIILFCQSLQLILQAPTAAPPMQAQGVEPAPPSLAIAYFPLAVPALVTAPGIAAILAFMAIASSSWAQKGIVLGTLLVIMGLNLATMLNHEAILKLVPPPLLRVVGWVMAVLLAALAVQYLFNSLIRLGVLHPWGS